MTEKDHMSMPGDIPGQPEGPPIGDPTPPESKPSIPDQPGAVPTPLSGERPPPIATPPGVGNEPPFRLSQVQMPDREENPDEQEMRRKRAEGRQPRMDPPARPGDGEEEAEAGELGPQLPDPNEILHLSPEELAKHEANAEVLVNINASEEDLVKAVEVSKMHEERAKKFLTDAGHDPEKIDAVLSRANLSPKPEYGEENEEEKRQIEEALEEGGEGKEKGIAGEVKDLFAEGQELNANENATQEDHEAFVEKSKGLMEKIRESKLFADETGLLRKEDRFSRLVAKPVGTMLLAMLVAYILALHSVTKSSAKKLGG